MRTPFREATALVSIEARGVIDSRVVELSRFKPVIELPVKGEWGPNVFVSVLAVRGRIEPLKWYSFFTWGWREPAAWFKEWWNPSQPTAMVDLAKPAYKIGLANIEVGIEAFRLKVEVSADKADYQPRDKAQVKIKVTQADGKPVPAGTEVAFAAVDQALLELRPNESWNLLDAMLPKRAYQVETATAQSQVIGKRHFGKKALPPGGGGGRAPARELFDTLLVWNPRVVLDADGSATLAVPLNDSLTEFKLVAVADAGTGLFGTGSASLRTRQDLQLISGLPPLVRENDRYGALLTVRNGTAKAMDVEVSAKAGERSLEAKAVKLDPESAAELVWAGEAPEGETALAWEFAAKDKSSTAADRLRVTQQVAPAVPITVQQATFARVDGELDIPAAVPTGAVSGKHGPLGGIEVALAARLSTPPPGLRRFFETYPFVCLEQKTSVAIGLRDAERWRQVVEALPTYLDANGLARYFPGDERGNAGSPALTAYLLDASQAAGFEIPPDLAQRMERGLTAFVEGRIKPEHWSPQSDLAVRKLAAIEALTRRGQKPLSALSSLEIEPLRLPTSALIDWYLIAKRVADLPERAEKLAAAERELRNRLSYIGGRLVFTSERSDYWWWLMVSGDANAFRLIEAVLDDPAWRDDLPALVQGAMLRQQRGRWLTTVANVWATIALDRFGRIFEKDEVSGSTHLALGDAPAQNFTWPLKDDASNRLLMPWPARPQSGDALKLTHEGSGKPWVSMQVLAAVPVKEPVANGFRVTREVMPMQEKERGKVSRGDVWRVRLTVESEQEMSWVVLDDPIPAGARILGEGDGRDSHIAGMDERDNGNAWPAYVERTFSTYRAYYGYVPRGTFSTEYTLRLNNAGEFALPATRVEAMYAPEVFGEAPNAKVMVE
ncbi:MAG: alpha-2-macroglobulin family protein [Propionivibrio sp.]